MEFKENKPLILVSYNEKQLFYSIDLSVTKCCSKSKKQLNKIIKNQISEKKLQNNNFQ